MLEVSFAIIYMVIAGPNETTKLCVNNNKGHSGHQQKGILPGANIYPAKYVTMLLCETATVTL